MDPIPPDAPEGLRVFGIGLNKTGTSSLGRFFRAAGFRLYENPTARSLRDPSPTECVLANFGVFEDWPWPLVYKEVAARVPGARFVLTTRASADEWYESLRRHAQRTGPTDQRSLVYGWVTPEGRKAEHTKQYLAHTLSVTKFFEDRAPGKLLVLPTDMPNERKSQAIADFLNMPRLAEIPYPVANKAPPARPAPTHMGWKPTARWVAAVKAQLAKAGKITSTKDRRFLANKYLTPIESKPFQRNKSYPPATIVRALDDDTRKGHMPRFAHVPKTGGTFITHTYVVENLGHRPGAQADLLVCRDPADRLASAHRYLRMAKSFWHADEGPSRYGKHPLAEWCRQHSFAEFAEAVCVAGTITDRHTTGQAAFSPNGVAHVLRFEKLDEGLAELEAEGVLRRSRFAPPGGVRNASSGASSGASAQEPIPPETLAVIEAFYRDDYLRFGYALAAEPAPLARDIREALEVRDVLKWGDAANLDCLAGASPRVLPGVAIVAAKHGRCVALKWLLGDGGVSPDLADALGTSLLHLAAYNGHADAVTLLLAAGADAAAKNKWGETPAQCAKGRAITALT